MDDIRFYVIIQKPEERWNFTGEPVAISILSILLIYMKMFKATQNASLLSWNGILFLILLFFFFSFNFYFKLLIPSYDLYIFYLSSSMEGGELFQRIQDRADGAFTERGTFRVKKKLNWLSKFYCCNFYRSC